MGLRFLGMGRVFLGRLFKSWSDVPTHRGMIPPTLWENALYPSIFAKRDIQGYKEPSKYTKKFLQVPYNYKYLEVWKEEWKAKVNQLHYESLVYGPKLS